jgi:hypothetical protein
MGGGVDGKADANCPHCNVPMHPGKTSEVHADTVDEFWNEIQEAHVHSLYSVSLYSGYMEGLNEATGVIVSPESAFVDDGHDILVRMLC